MKCILMNKNTPVLLLEYNTEYNIIKTYMKFII